jgi:hypothetical protein
MVPTWTNSARSTATAGSTSVKSAVTSAPYDGGNSSRKRFRRLNTRESGTDPWTARILNTHGPRMRPDDGGVLPMSL